MASLALMIARLPDHSMPDLRLLWREVFGFPCPHGNNRMFMMRRIAHAWQVKRYGGLSDLDRKRLAAYELFPLEQRNIVQTLVRRVEMSPQGADIHMHMDRIGHVMEENNSEELYDESRKRSIDTRDSRPHALSTHRRADHGFGTEYGHRHR